MKAITGGTDALGEVSCLVRQDGRTVAGQGAHSDIVMASALALINAFNRLESRGYSVAGARGRRAVAGCQKTFMSPQRLRPACAETDLLPLGLSLWGRLQRGPA